MSTRNISEHNLVEVVKKGKEEGIIITEEAWAQFINNFNMNLKENQLLIKSKAKNSNTPNEDLKTYYFFRQLEKFKNRLFEKNTGGG